MIVKKNWTKYKLGKDYRIKKRYSCTGWFLFGIIPLYIIKYNIDA